MITLLSPAKSLNFDDTAAPQYQLTDHIFPKETMQLVRILKKKNSSDLKELMSISDNIAALNVQRYKGFKKDYSTGVSKAAIAAFTGDVYQGFEYETLTDADLDYAQSHLRILSGLYGVLRPFDQMQAYRLEMGTRLENKAGSNLYHFWGKKIAKAINTDLQVGGHDTVLNLASNEYWKAVDKKTLKAQVITANFKEERDGQLKFISFSAKKARGLMARYVIQNRVESVDHLLGFDIDGYHYSADHSTDTELLFVR